MRIALLLSLALLTSSCGGPDESLIAGTYDFGIYYEPTDTPLTCNGGQYEGTGTLVLREDQPGLVTGIYDLCGSLFTGKDVSGHVEGATFDLTLFGGTLNAIEGRVTATTLYARVLGAGEHVVLRGVRKK